MQHGRIHPDVCGVVLRGGLQNAEVAWEFALCQRGYDAAASRTFDLKADLRADRQGVAHPIILNESTLVRRHVDHDIRPEPPGVEITRWIQRGKGAEARSAQDVYGIAVEKAVFQDSLIGNLITMPEAVDVRPIFLEGWAAQRRRWL